MKMKYEDVKEQYDTLLAVSGTIDNERRYIHRKLIILVIQLYFMDVLFVWYFGRSIADVYDQCAIFTRCKEVNIILKLIVYRGYGPCIYCTAYNKLCGKCMTGNFSKHKNLQLHIKLSFCRG